MIVVQKRDENMEIKDYVPQGGRFVRALAVMDLVSKNSFFLAIVRYDLLAMSNLGEKYNLWTIISILILIALPFGAPVDKRLNLNWVFHGISRLFKGKASYDQTNAAIYWAFAPRGINLVFWIINIAIILGARFSLGNPVIMSGLVLYTYQATTFLMALLGVWTWVRPLQTLSEINGYSAWVSYVVAVLYAFVLAGTWILISMFVNIFVVYLQLSWT